MEPQIIETNVACSPAKSKQNPIMISGNAARLTLHRQLTNNVSREKTESWKSQTPCLSREKAESLKSLTSCVNRSHESSVYCQREYIIFQGRFVTASATAETKFSVARSGPSSISARAGTSSICNPTSLALASISAVRLSPDIASACWDAPGDSPRRPGLKCFWGWWWRCVAIWRFQRLHLLLLSLPLLASTSYRIFSFPHIAVILAVSTPFSAHLSCRPSYILGGSSSILNSQTIQYISPLWSITNIATVISLVYPYRFA